MSFLTKDELESYLNKLPNNDVSSSFNKLNINNDDTPDTPKPAPQKSFSNNKIPLLQQQQQKKKRNSVVTIQSDQNPTCPSCHKLIQGSVVSAMNALWHASCFTCYKCNKTMESEKYYEHKGHPYCFRDYKKLFSLSCDFCKKPITTHAISALGKHYHEDHFCCTCCNKPFKNGQFLIYKEKPYCETDYLRMCGKKCFGCNEFIKGEYINALNHEWHKTCFHCTVCKKTFSDGTFRVCDEKPYCAQHCPTQVIKQSNPETRKYPNTEKRQQSPNILKKDHQQKTCHHCKEKIFGPCVNALDHCYHVSHFQCVYCHRTLSSRVPAMWQADAQGELICKQCASKQ